MVAVIGPVFVACEEDGAGLGVGDAALLPDPWPPPGGTAAAVMHSPVVTADRSALWLAVIVVEPEKLTVVWLVADCTCIDPADTWAIVPLAADRCCAPWPLRLR
jgi:hypothetical protein